MVSPTFHLHLPNPYLAGACITALVKGVSWERLDVTNRRGQHLVVPDWMVDAEHRVEDETAYAIGAENEMLDPASQVINAGSILLVLESPHKMEFRERGGPAIGPLRDPNTRRRLKERMPELLREAVEITGLDVRGRGLVLANAVQYQTSLQALRTDYASAIEPRIRDAVWTMLFEAGGADDLLRRLHLYRPALVIIASTKFSVPMLREAVSQAERGWPTLFVDEHPTRWWNVPHIVDAL